MSRARGMSPRTASSGAASALTAVALLRTDHRQESVVLRLMAMQMLLPQLVWRRFRCEVCGRLFELPSDIRMLPVHAPRRTGNDGTPCPGREPVPV